jgi:tRNA(Ile)-lysidine synthase
MRAERAVSEPEQKQIDDAARALLSAPGQVVLAISGGRDSMALLHAVHGAIAAAAPGQRTAPVRVVTFDHGTGPAATRAAALVVGEARRLGLHAHSGRATQPAATEAAWRAARWAYFASVLPPDGTIATAHTRDDHVETVAMRVIRGSGARGLAGLEHAAPRITRPFVRIARDVVARYADSHGVRYVEDPSNASRRHFRNRVRLDLLPAIRRLRPAFEVELADLSERAAELRADLDRFVTRFIVADDGARHRLRVAREELATYDSAALCVLWPAIAARVGVTLDRRGTQRLAQFTTSGVPGGRIQLSGGVEVYRHRDASLDGFAFRRAAVGPSPRGIVSLRGIVEFGEWRFRPIAATATRADETPDARSLVHPQDEIWSADLPGDRCLTVRAWQPGDRMRAGDRGPARRVKRFFGDARIPGPSRSGWPVVLADDEIVWIPGVRRVPAAPERSGRPMVRYICERFDGGFAYS